MKEYRVEWAKAGISRRLCVGKEVKHEGEYEKHEGLREKKIENPHRLLTWARVSRDIEAAIIVRSFP